MRDLVETVIDGILQREKMQQHAQRQQQHRAAIKSRPLQSNHAQLHAAPGHAIAAGKDKDPALWKVSRQFEAIFVQQMMSEMRKTVQKSDFIPNGFAEDVHGSMMDEAIAQASVRHHSFGIADNIYRQLEAAQARTAGPRLKQTAPNPHQTAQEISASADTLQISDDRTTEANNYAH